jgi:DNA-binding CsgD family transcriptional regulator
MPDEKRATAPLQFVELLQCFPCPAWIENPPGKILARNDRKVAGATWASCSRPGGRNTPPALKTTVYPLPSADNAKDLRLVALFPAARETSCQHGVIAALLAKSLLPPQPAAPDVPSEAKSLITRLTPREREIYCELARGCRYKEAARRIGTSHEVVRQLVVRIRRKLGNSCVPTLRRRP